MLLEPLHASSLHCISQANPLLENCLRKVFCVLKRRVLIEQATVFIFGETQTFAFCRLHGCVFYLHRML